MFYILYLYIGFIYYSTTPFVGINQFNDRYIYHPYGIPMMICLDIWSVH